MKIASKLFEVPLAKKPKTFYMLILTWSLIVAPYQNILIKPTKTTWIATKRDYLSVLFG